MNAKQAVLGPVLILAATTVAIITSAANFGTVRETFAATLAAVVVGLILWGACIYRKRRI